MWSERYAISPPFSSSLPQLKFNRTGHWIQDCPTNSDRAYDDKPRIKRTTGIPKSFLTVVEGPGGDSNSNGGNGTGVMVTPDGGFVVARPDK